MLIANSHRRGDTLVEVILAFAVFTLVAVGTNAIMNRGIALAEQSLEITLVRQQIDAQAELLRYARSINSSVWANDIKPLAKLLEADSTSTSPPDTSSMASCPADATPPEYSFMLSVDDSTEPALIYRRLDVTVGSPYLAAETYSQFDTSSSTPNFYGIWVVPVRIPAAAGAATEAYDMHIGTCWNVPGSRRPLTLNTIVRLYDVAP